MPGPQEERICHVGPMQYEVVPGCGEVGAAGKKLSPYLPSISSQ